MTIPNFIRELEQIVGREQLSVARSDTEIYSYDASLAKGTPDMVVFPGDTAQVARVVRLAHRAGIPFVPRGFGTNLSGGTVLLDGGLVICLSRLNRIVAIHPERRYARVQPGVTNLELQTALAKCGFFYAPDPASQKVATLGGNIGENSGGPRCLRYGVTTNHVLGMTMVAADGEIYTIGGPALDPPGYDLRGLLVGSEGTLGVVTEAMVRILPQTEKVITLLAIYDDVSQAAHSVSAIIAAGIVPLTLEMMDNAIIQAVEESYRCGYPRDAAAVLIIEVEGPQVGLREQTEKISDVCRQHNCREIRRAADETERSRLWEGRRGAFGAVARLAPNYLVNDCSVPRTRLPQALVQVAEITTKYGFQHGNVFHAGDGNLHPLIFFDSRDPDQLERVKKAGWEIMLACVRLGGTISGEHGVGIEKMDAMRLIYTESDLAVQRSLKAAFDADDHINPGKVIPPICNENGEENLPSDILPNWEAQATAGEKALQGRVWEALARNQSLLISGNGTLAEYGNHVSDDATAISTQSLRAILDFDSANQVITAEAGIPLRHLQSHLASQEQWLPLRPPPNCKTHTLGGVAALNRCGPERLAYGAPRDLLLGLRFIDGHGRLVAAGGQVVKNVSGYDITRLLVGSAGTLGPITVVTSRVSMLPPRCAALSAGADLATCLDSAVAVLCSQLAPTLVVLRPVEMKAAVDEWRIVVGFEGFAETVVYQLEQCSDLFVGTGLRHLAIAEYDVYEGPLGGEFRRMARAPFNLCADLAIHRLSELIHHLRGLPEAEGILVDVGCGRAWTAVTALDDTRWLRLGQSVAAMGGHVMLEKAPMKFKTRNEVFAPPRSEWRLSHRIKAELDPRHLYAPGRLPGRAVSL